MPVTLEQLEDFHRFAQAKLGSVDAPSLAELARQWQAARERSEVDEALREATEELRAGRYRPAAEVTRDIVRKFNLPS